MKIASIETIPLRIPFTTGGKSAGGVWGPKDLQMVDSLVVKITTDDGIVGWGETFGFTAIPAAKIVIDTILAPELIGSDVTLREKLQGDLQKNFTSSVAAARSSMASRRLILRCGISPAKRPVNRSTSCLAVARPRRLRRMQA